MIVTVLLLTAVVGADAAEVKTNFIASEATRRAGGYSPIRAEMGDKADSVKKAPEGLKSPRYGKLKLSGKSWGFILDEPEGGKASLFIDSNGDGDYTNDPKAAWSATKSRGQTLYRGSGKVDLGGDRLGAINLYRFDPSDPRRAQYKNIMLYYADYGYEVSLKLDGKPFTTFVGGDIKPNSRLWIDRDGNKKRSYKLETVYVDKPFNFTGTTYILASTDAGLEIKKAPQALPMTPLPPDLSIGKRVVDFRMPAMDGSDIEFPGSYAGKLVMLDFWATWCGPCIAELPNVKKAYETWHDKGFDVLGISFDREGMTEKLEAFTKKNEMPWKHIYEGKGWNTSIGELYDVSAIPFVLLVDGDTGEILATARQLRGPGLTEFIGKALEKKKKASKN